MSEAHRKRGPQFWGFCLGTGWVVLLTLGDPGGGGLAMCYVHRAVFGFMVAGYLQIFGIRGQGVRWNLPPFDGHTERGLQYPGKWRRPFAGVTA